MSKTVFLWDIDGTILLTGGSGRASFNQIFEDLYQEKNMWNDYDPHGMTDYRIINDLYVARFGKKPSEDEVQKIAKAYCQRLALDLQTVPNFRLMPMAKEIIGNLALRNDVLLGLATGNFKETAYQKLKCAGVDHHFNFGGFGCDASEREVLTQKALDRAKEALGAEPKDVYVIGDTIHDVRCGRAIGAKTVAVRTTNTTRDAFEKAGATYILEDLREFEAKVYFSSSEAPQ